MRLNLPCTAAFALLLATAPALADTVGARCEFLPNDQREAQLELPCQFSQRQGAIGIARADGVRHDLTPQAAPGTFKDEAGQRVLRVRGLGAQGQVFKLAHGTLRVRWLNGTPAEPGRLPVVGLASGPFERSLSLQGIGFRVQAANGGPPWQVRITPSGLKVDNSAWVREVEGKVIGAEVADLNADGSPEVYVYVQAPGSGSIGSLMAMGANARKSLSEISLPALDQQAGAGRGYQGHDQFAVVEGRLVRRFPIYRDGDTNAQPSGGVRQLQYRLTQGEATWMLRLDRMTEF